MKKIVYILFFAMTFTACESPDTAGEWDRVDLLIGQHADFDPAVVPALLTGNKLSFSSYFILEGQNLLYSDRINLYLDGWSHPQYLFFENGICWRCWTDMAHIYDGGQFHREYRWSYDAQTRTLLTWIGHVESRAVVKAFDGEGHLYLDGDLCSEFGARMVFKLDPDPDLRAEYLEKYRNVADYE